MSVIRQAGEDVFINVRVQPRADRNGITGLRGDAVKLRLTAPPVDGAANQACLKFFAKLLKVPLAQVEIVTGRAGRDKTIKITGANAGDVIEKCALGDLQ